MRLLQRFIVALVLLVALAVPALATEQIDSFDSNTTLKSDGAVDVTETIAVTAEGDRIRHGIFRDVFTVLRNADGSKFYADFKVLDVTRDGHKEPFTLDGIPNGKRVKIGDADTYLDTGPHTYTIHYTMSRMARSFDTYDELYWNVTGNFWDFPILRATATLTLPQGAKISKSVVFTGPVGSTAHDATLAQTADNVMTVRTNNVLSPGEGMTVALAFQKGLVAQSTGPADWLSDHRESIVPLVALLIVGAFNFWAWTRVGRDPKKGTVIPLFHPPEGMSPAQAQWVHRMGFDGTGWKALTAGLFDLGAKGLVTVDNSDKTMSVTGTGATPATPLPADEQVLFDFFGGTGTKFIDKANGPTINAKRTAMLAAITKPNRGVYFNSNGGYVAVAVIIAVACLIAMVALDVIDAGWLIGAVVVGIVIAVLAAIVRGRIQLGSLFGIGFGVIWLVIFAGNALVSLGHAAVSDFALNAPAVGAISIAAVTAVFGLIMRAPTVAGRKVMDQLDGLLMYLNTAEKNRLNIDGEPPLTIKRFEALLPFAIALGVEKPWTDKFNTALAAGQVSDAHGLAYAPVWYTGNNSFSSNNVTSNIAAISTAMTAAMAASVPSQSSSSGSSGGGSSGGGGGGGGGGGW